MYINMNVRRYVCSTCVYVHVHVYYVCTYIYTYLFAAVLMLMVPLRRCTSVSSTSETLSH